MSEAYTEQDLRRVQNVLHHGRSPYGDPKLLCACQDCRRIAAEFSRIRSEARAGMREACAIVADLQANRWHEGTAGSEASTLIAHKIRSTPDFAADEAIERIKREAHESGIREGASNEALLQRMFNEDGPVKIELERIKREARLDELSIIGNLMEGCYVDHSQYPDDVEFDEGQFVAAMNQRRAALSGKETEHESS